MASAIAAAAARWGTTGVTTRLTMLAVLLVTVTAASEFLVKRLEIVGRVLIHLCAYLVLPTVIAATAQLGGSWRSCILLGGIGGALAVGFQGRRMHAPLLVGSTALGGIVASGGAAALWHAPVAPIIATLAIIAAAFGSSRRTTVLACAAVGVPITVGFARLGIGAGTLHDLGAVGHAARVGAVGAGIIAGIALLIAARRNSSLHHLFAALAAFGSSVVALTKLVTFPVPPHTLIPGIVVLGAELALHGALRSTNQRIRSIIENRLDLADALELLAVVFSAQVLLSSRRPAAACCLLSAGFALGVLRRRQSVSAFFPAVAAAGYLVVGLGFVSVAFGICAGAVMLGLFAAALASDDLAHASALTGAVGVACTVATLVDRGHEPNTTAGLIVAVLALVALGITTIIPTVRPAQTYAVTSALCVPFILQSWQSLVGIGLVLAVYGLAMKVRPITGVGLVALSCGGLIGALVEHAPRDIRALIFLAVLALGEVALRSVDPVDGPWFVPATSLGSCYLVLTALDGSPARLAWTAVIGMVMIAVGAVTEQRATLYAGLATTATVVLIAGNEQLRSLPTWVWVMVGGLSLLGVAAMIERSRTHRIVGSPRGAVGDARDRTQPPVS